MSVRVSSNSTVPPSGEVTLRVMATSDLHAALRGFDYCADSATPGLGLEGAAALIGQLRRQRANCLLFDNGDFLQGNPLADLFADPARNDPHPVIAAMNALGYDAAAIGNHEFNYGLPTLRRALAQAQFPLLAANIAPLGGEAPVGLPHTLLLRQFASDAGSPVTLKIGVFGVLPPQIMIWDHRHLHGYIQATDMVSAAEKSIAALQAEGADLIIALCHSGIEASGPAAKAENMAGQVAALPGVDAIVAGHSHEVFPATGNLRLADTPAVMPGCFGSHVGVIDLRLTRTESGPWRCSAVNAEARSVAAAVGVRAIRHSPEAKLVRRATADAHRTTRRLVRRPVGETTVPLTTHLATLPGNAALALIADAQAAYVARGLRGTRFADLPLLSAASPFKFGGRGGPSYYTNVPAGLLALRHVADLYIHPNRIAAVVVTGRELHAWLERSAEIFVQIEPGIADQPLLDPDRHGSEFDVIHGLRYRIDPSMPKGRRITDLQWADQPVLSDDRFVVATNSYRAEGGGEFPGAAPDNIVLEHPVMVQEVLRDHVGRIGRVLAPACRPWDFSSFPGTSALFETSRGARLDLDRLPLEDLGDTAPGLARFRLRL